MGDGKLEIKIKFKLVKRESSNIKLFLTNKPSIGAETSKRHYKRKLTKLIKLFCQFLMFLFGRTTSYYGSNGRWQPALPWQLSGSKFFYGRSSQTICDVLFKLWEFETPISLSMGWGGGGVALVFLHFSIVMLGSSVLGEVSYLCIKESVLLSRIYNSFKFNLL